MRFSALLNGALFYSSALFAQTDSSQAVRTLDSVEIRAFEQNRPARFSTASVSLLDWRTAGLGNKTSLLTGLNTLPGVRLEERSPGSYRLNIRGSSLRSPFGVRNVKVYWNDLPFTDPGGNTYFNQFAANNFSGMEIYKGPAGSMYGAGTGGLVLLNTAAVKKPFFSAEYMTGSYGLHNLFIDSGRGDEKNNQQFSYAHNQSAGYREQSAMRRDNLSWLSRMQVSGKQSLTAGLLYSALWYQTPGALTAAEFTNNPSAARPAAGGFPSAVAARAAIAQQNLTAGFTSRYQLQNNLSNQTSLYGSFARVRNAAVRNYERRLEPSWGARTHFIYRTEKNGNKSAWTAGAEWQQGWFNTQVSNNRNGNPDTLQTNDDLDFTTLSVFVQGDWQWKNGWLLTTGLSLNKNRAAITRLNRFPVLRQERRYRNEAAPRLVLKKLLDERTTVKALVSRGFSPPTVSELLPSTGVISTELEAEYGWNYETAFSRSFFGHRLRVEAAGYYFRLNKALVQRRDLSGADYFVNAGNLNYKGLELTADYTRHYPAGLTACLSLQAAYSFNHYRYGSFRKGPDDFSGRTVPSVPARSFSLLADWRLRNGFYLSSTLYSASRIFLNDANTAVAAAYYLVGVRAGWKIPGGFSIYSGADNLLNQTYSLGNDINAAAGRFYNAAAPRNWLAGISWRWNKGE